MLGFWASPKLTQFPFSRLRNERTESYPIRVKKHSLRILTLSSILLTGAAGFIANQVAERLLAAGHTVVGVDNLNNAYDVRLKEWRLSRLRRHPGFRFHPVDITDRNAIRQLCENPTDSPFEAIINLAARAGVRQSVENP